MNFARDCLRLKIFFCYELLYAAFLEKQNSVVFATIPSCFPYKKRFCCCVFLLVSKQFQILLSFAALGFCNAFAHGGWKLSRLPLLSWSNTQGRMEARQDLILDVDFGVRVAAYSYQRCSKDFLILETAAIPV